MSLTSMVVEEGEKTWKDFGLDNRILQAVKGLKYKRPTMIQESCIPLALAGKDILARAGTGSGKTAAYTLPICHKLLRAAAQGGRREEGVKVMVLVPSKELCDQVLRHFRAVLSCSEGLVHAVDLSAVEPHEWGGERCDVAIGTPTTVLRHAEKGNISLARLACCVVDEADALLSQPTVRRLRCMYPTTVQSFLMSATLSPAVLELKKLLLNAPVVVKLEEEDAAPPGGAADAEAGGSGDEEEGEEAAAAAGGLTTQPNIRQEFLTYHHDSERYCFLYAMIRYGMVKGKVLIFVDGVDKGYKLKLFLDKFGVRAAVLNAEVPLASRNHIVASFNVGDYKYLIATDKVRPPGAAGAKDEYGVSRGIDFREVTAVVNFDSFASLTEEGCKSYVHRIGRTGRAGKAGLAITFVQVQEERKLGWLRYLGMYLESKGQTLHPHEFLADATEARKLQYRADDALLGIKKKAIKEAKVRELVNEALASETLKQHFSENPNDLAALKHVAPQKKADKRVAEVNSFVPDYMGAKVAGKLEDVHEEPQHEEAEDEDPDAEPVRRKQSAAKKKKTVLRRKADPLRRLTVKRPADAGADAGAGEKAPAAKRKRVVVVKKKVKKPAA